jgi:ATP-binding cassette, subfamily C (CFTR/MRP), member 1
LASIVAFIVHAATGGALDVAKVFSSLAIFNSIRSALGFLPIVMVQLVTARSAYKRISYFLNGSNQMYSVEINHSKDISIAMMNATFDWSPSIQVDNPGCGILPAKVSNQQHVGEIVSSEEKQYSNSPIISNVTLSLTLQCLVAVAGSRSSGKTALLKSIAGEMYRVNGTHVVGSKPVYCPEEPWIQSTTARQNIIFGIPFDQAWYESVVTACALQTDFRFWPDGDETKLGEGGIILSGGQRRRIGIARAIYSRAKTVLLDNVLSGLDPKVTNHIVKFAIQGLMKDRCCILVTSSSRIIQECDFVLFVERGQVKTFNSATEFLRTEMPFIQFNGLDRVSADQLNNELDIIENVSIRKEHDSGTGTLDGGTIDMGVVREPTRNISLWIQDRRIRVLLVFGIPLLLIGQLATIVTALWLSWWTSKKFRFAGWIWMIALTAFAVAQTCIIFTFSALLTHILTGRSTNALRYAVKSILYGFTSEVEKLGSLPLLQRCSVDVEILDTTFIEAARMCIILSASKVSLLK